MKMEFEEICRTCLGSKSLNPIFKNKEHHERFSLALANTTGLKVELNDGFPQNICIECMSQINSSLKFRARCKDTEAQLKQIYQIDRTDNFEDQESILKQENVLKTEYFDIKMEIDIEDVKPISNFHKTKFLNFESRGSENTDIAFDSKSSITILENKLIDVKYIKRKSKKKKEKHTLKDSIKNEDEIDSSFLTEINDTILGVKEESEVKKQLDIKVENRRVKCRICKKSLSVRSVNAHMNKRHPGSDERRVKCELCEEYVLKTKLEQHIIIMHGTEYTKCSYCKMEFSDKNLLIEHVASCTFKKQTRRQVTGKEMSECDVCHKKMQRASLRMHQRIKHAGLGPVCDHCGRKFGNKLRLSEHLRSRHGHDKYSCKHCPFTSAALLAMRNHERRHLGDKPFVCESCGARFHAAYLLTQHRQSHRTNKPAKCDLCPATFKANNSLHMHRASCHSVSSYKCTLCEKDYSCRSYALRHLRSVHGYKSCDNSNVIKIV